MWQILGAVGGGFGLAVAFVRLVGSADEARIKALEHEIERLREWRHTVGNFQQNQVALEVLIDRVKRLEAKIFNGVQH